ncbi:NAD-dependent epimerase/dehydratase family protein [Salinisphaera hydrothermalis]|uniref:Nucleoside-diphosphate-sugar epimerase n=1 Tax=Salinisphaera hydrothermalis (strain C41B8) TaxID=1304275 RepID=A0A084INI4_SALHC|nr:NAD(P)-dependent oxidoreductase [Salinisphaera hydrothermalis]KEZ78268.1 nucleoside-diphosphate-sugar epimerase [Salinisphaera hydrothermalis C41B8]
MSLRILFTGGSGKAGRHVVPYLLDRGHTVVNIDRTPLDDPRVHNLVADITDAGQMFNALTAYAHLGELDEANGGPKPFDAVVHFAAIPRILVTPDNETYRVNAVGTYNVLEAATKLGVRKIVFASSETTYGICFAEGEVKPDFLPVTEDHPTDPIDSYAMSKVCNEATARAFAKRSGADIYGLRIGNVIEPHEYATYFPRYFDDPSLRRRNIFCYIDARDLGQIVDRCLATDGLGYQMFNAGNDHNSVDLTTAEIIEEFYPDVPVRGELGEYEALYSNRKIREMLGFVEEHPWHRYVTSPRLGE